MTSEDVVDAELRVATAAIGLSTPPADLVARVVAGRDAWTLVVRVPAPDAAAVAEWLAWEGGRVESFGTAHRRVLRAAFRRLPKLIERVHVAFRVRGVHFTRDGTTRLVVTAPRLALREFVNATPGVRVGRCGPRRPDEDALLTPRQEEVLARAVREGYYQVPRRITLVALATKCGISTSSLSELLRRAEERVISRYAEGDAMEPAPALVPGETPARPWE